jgi:mersacidin/lichenicidin family type 2 lantibiotic
MSNSDIIRAWKDDNYLDTLSEQQRSQLPAHPAGIVELSDEDMENFAGGANFSANGGAGDCTVQQVSANGGLDPRCVIN